MQSENSEVQPDSLINNDQESNSKEINKTDNPVQKKTPNNYEIFFQNFDYISKQNNELILKNRNLVSENESLKQQLICFNNLKVEIEQKEKQVEDLSIQSVENSNLWSANTRHIQEIGRYIQLLEYKQQYIKSLELQLKEVSEKYKLTNKKDEFLIPDDLVNKSYLNDGDKYFVEKEYQKQKEYQEFKKRYKQDLLLYKLQ